MKKIEQLCFLFRKQPDSEWSARKRAGFWAWNIFLFITSSVWIGIFSLLMAAGPYEMFLGFFEVPLIAYLNLLPGVLLSLFLYALTGRTVVAYTIHAVLVFILSFVHYQKLFLRDDPFQFSDLVLAKEAGNIMQNYRIVLDWKVVIFALTVVLGILCHLFFIRGHAGKDARIAYAAVAVILGTALIPVYTSENTYNNQAANDKYLKSAWSSTQKFVSHGFIYPFLHSIQPESDAAKAIKQQKHVEVGVLYQMSMPGDIGVNLEEVIERPEPEQLYQFYQDADIPEYQKVNLVGIMLEAYNDFTKFAVDIPFNENIDIYGVWHDLQEEGYSGRLVTNVFAGGTVDTERSYLTGYSTLPEFTSDTLAYPWYFQSQGYTVEGMHAGYEWFYDRNSINPRLGFENYYFIENYFQEITGDTLAPRDDVFFPELIRQYEEKSRDGTPYFQFSVSYQGHGPFDDSNLLWGEPGDYVTSGVLPSAEQTILENYLGSIYNTNKNLKKLTDYFREDDSPVVLVLFGDHNPWLGDGNSVYDALGIDFSAPGKEGFLEYYATEYLIWANPAAKKILGNDFQGSGPDIGPYYLMHEVFSLCGWKGPAYMQATQGLSEAVPVVHRTGQFITQNELTDTLVGEEKTLVEWYEALQVFVQEQGGGISAEEEHTDEYVIESVKGANLDSE